MKKDILSYKLARIILVLLLLIATAMVSALITHRLMLREQHKETPESAVIQETSTNEAITKSIAFLEIAEKLKQQAYNAIRMLYPEKAAAIEDVGEKLKEILDSDYADLLTNETFNSDEFSVAITNYPLQDGGIIQRIEYHIKDMEKDQIEYSVEGARFFLRYNGYNGKDSFYSDIEQLGYGKEEFQVFENSEGCFVFRVFSVEGVIAFSSTKKYSTYDVTIYVLRENGFHSEWSVNIPLKVASNDNFRFIQQDNIIKGVTSDYNYPEQIECIFNPATLKFELPKSKKSTPIDYDIPGLLLGLSDSNGNIRTLWIRKEEDKICADEYAGQIIFQRQNKLFSVEHYTFYGDFFDSYTDSSGEEVNFCTGSIDLKKLICGPLGKNLTDIYEKSHDSGREWGYFRVNDIPLYVGEDYVCYIQKTFHSGGGTFHASSVNIRFDKIDYLNNFTFDNGDWGYGGLSPDFDETFLVDLVYGENAKYLCQSDIATYGGELQPYVDFRQLAIKRNLGKWSLMLPVMDEYHHPGNGSYGNWVNSFAAYSNDVPAFLTSHEESVELGEWDTWNAKDIFKFPGSDAALIQYDYFIGIYNDGKKAISIPVNLDEYIVSINFADNGLQEDWTNELKIEFDNVALLETHISSLPAGLSSSSQS